MGQRGFPVVIGVGVRESATLGAPKPIVVRFGRGFWSASLGALGDLVRRVPASVSDPSDLGWQGPWIAVVLALLGHRPARPGSTALEVAFALPSRLGMGAPGPDWRRGSRVRGRSRPAVSRGARPRRRRGRPRWGEDSAGPRDRVCSLSPGRGPALRLRLTGGMEGAGGQRDDAVGASRWGGGGKMTPIGGRGGETF